MLNGPHLGDRRGGRARHARAQPALRAPATHPRRPQLVRRHRHDRRQPGSHLTACDHPVRSCASDPVAACFSVASVRPNRSRAVPVSAGSLRAVRPRQYAAPCPAAPLPRGSGRCLTARPRRGRGRWSAGTGPARLHLTIAARFSLSASLNSARDRTLSLASSSFFRFRRTGLVGSCFTVRYPRLEGR